MIIIVWRVFSFRFYFRRLDDLDLARKIWFCKKINPEREKNGIEMITRGMDRYRIGNGIMYTYVVPTGYIFSKLLRSFVWKKKMK